MPTSIKSFLKVCMFLAFGMGILYLVYRVNNAKFLEDCITNGTPLSECNFLESIINDISSTNIKWILLAIVFYTWSNIARAIRWKMMITPLGKTPKLANTIATVLITHLVNLGVPRSGEFVRAGLIAKYEDLEAEKVMGTIVTSRMIDVFCLLITIGLTLILSYDNFMGYFADNEILSFGGESSMLYLLVGLGIFGMTVITLIWNFREAVLETAIGKKIWNIILGFWEGLLSVRKLEKPIVFVFHTVSIWVCYYLMTYLMFFSFDATAELAPVTGLVVFVFGTLGIVIPSPGGMGTYQFLISEALMLYGLPFDSAFSFSNVMFFSIQIWNVLLGIIAFFALPFINRK